MNLGIEGKWALVCAASKGLGKGCAQALVREGVNVVITARGEDALQATAAELRALNGGGVRGGVRVHLQRARGLPQRAEHPARRRCVSGDLLKIGKRVFI